MKKDGSFDSLIYNDALFRNKQHVLNPKMINAPETWVSKFKKNFLEDCETSFVNLTIRYKLYHIIKTKNKFYNNEIFRN